MQQIRRSSTAERPVDISIGPAALEGSLVVPPQARGVVLFAHGSGSSRHSPRNRFVAGVFQEGGLATLLPYQSTQAEPRAAGSALYSRYRLREVGVRTNPGGGFKQARATVDPPGAAGGFCGAMLIARATGEFALLELGRC